MAYISIAIQQALPYACIFLSLLLELYSAPRDHGCVSDLGIASGQALTQACIFFSYCKCNLLRIIMEVCRILV